jgi:pyridoxamine 5'-phosphate oxidase-like protein
MPKGNPINGGTRWAASIWLATFIVFSTTLPCAALAAQHAGATPAPSVEAEATSPKIHELLTLLADPGVQVNGRRPRMNRAKILEFAKRHRLAVLATVSAWNIPEAAAVTEELELVFDTLTTSRKYINLKANPNIAFVIGWDNEATLQAEGIAEELRGSALPSL